MCVCVFGRWEGVHLANRPFSLPSLPNLPEGSPRLSIVRLVSEPV